jgi:hypothetical protein
MRLLLEGGAERSINGFVPFAVIFLTNSRNLGVLRALSVGWWTQGAKARKHDFHVA